MRQTEVLAYSVNDAAVALSLSKRTIYNLIEDGTLRTFKIGRRTLIPADDVRALVPK